MYLRTLTLTVALAVLAACVTEPAQSTPQGEIRIGSTTYPILSRGDQWFVRTDRRLVQCLRPTEQDCYWSLRAYIQSRQTPEYFG